MGIQAIALHALLFSAVSSLANCKDADSSSRSKLDSLAAVKRAVAIGANQFASGEQQDFMLMARHIVLYLGMYRKSSNKPTSRRRLIGGGGLLGDLRYVRVTVPLPFQDAQEFLDAFLAQLDAETAAVTANPVRFNFTSRLRREIGCLR